jgi:transketolase
MLNPNLKLNPKLFNEEVEQIPIRKGFGEGLVKAGEINKNVVALCADLKESTQMNLFADKFPERFIEVGVAEQNLVTIASGAAHFNFLAFILASVVTRGVRFFAIAALLRVYGEPVQAFIEKRLDLVSWSFLALVIGGIAAVTLI